MMTGGPDVIDAGASAACDGSGDTEMVAGQAELGAFERARAAYCPAQPESERALLEAFRRFHLLGYEAYFSGATVMPAILAVQPLVAGMWTDGYRFAETQALTMKCQCDCSRAYVWGKGYGHCARRASRHDALV